MARLAKQFGLLGLVGILASCTAGGEPTQAIDALVTSNPGTVTTLVPLLTPSPQLDNTQTSVPSPTPDVSLYDDGAWLLFQGSDPDEHEKNNHLWAVNWDGTGLMNLLPDFYVYQHKVQPAVNGSPGRYVAVITSYGWSGEFMLIVAHLPDGEIVASIPLTNPQTELVDYPTEDDADYRDYYRRAASSMSISDLRSLAWSPDGTQIAFSGAQEGTQTDVYIYSLTDGSVSRLTRGQHPHHASNLLWSPDGQYIAYDDVSTEGTGLGYWANGIWVVRVDGSTVRRIASEEEWPRTDDGGNRPQKLGWTSDHTLAIYALHVNGFEFYRLREVDISTWRSTEVVEQRYCEAAFAAHQDIWLVEKYDMDGKDSYLIRDGIHNRIEPLDCYWPIWSADLNAFITPQGLVRTDGEIMKLDLPESLPLISPDGAYWAYPRGEGGLEPEEQQSVITWDALWIGEVGKQPEKLSNTWFEVLQWSPNSRSVLVTNMDEGLQYIAIVPDFKLHLISKYDTSRYKGPWWDGVAIDN